MTADRRVETPEPLAAILTTALDAVIVMDREGKISDWNQAAAHAFGWSRIEALGRVLSELIIPIQYRANHKAGLERYLSTSVGPLLRTNMGDLKGLVAQLQQGGLNEQVRSWLGNGQNLQITPEQVESALGNEKLQQLAAQFGIPLETVSRLLAEHLPKAVDQASPEGVIQNS